MRSERINLRLSKEEKVALEKAKKKSPFERLSDFIRAILKDAMEGRR